MKDTDPIIARKAWNRHYRDEGEKEDCGQDDPEYDNSSRFCHFDDFQDRLCKALLDKRRL